MWLFCVFVKVRCNSWEYHLVRSEHRHGAHHWSGCSLWMCCRHPALAANVGLTGGLPWHTQDLLLRCLPQVCVKDNQHAHMSQRVQPVVLQFYCNTDALNLWYKGKNVTFCQATASRLVGEKRVKLIERRRKLWAQVLSVSGTEKSLCHICVMYVCIKKNQTNVET